jgi:hypothetical protein
MLNISIGYGEVTLGIVGLLVIQFLLATWLKARIEGSIRTEYDRQLTAYKHEFDKKIEDYRNDIRIREQAAKIADLLAYARWNQGTNGEAFDRKVWELSLWLPTDICCQLSECLAKKRDIGSVKQILIDVRKLLLKDKAGELNAGNILHAEIVPPVPKP